MEERNYYKNASFRLMCISKSLNELLNRKKRLEEILSGQYDYIIDTDMDSIKNAIESGKLPENNALSKLHVFFKINYYIILHY